MAVDGWGALFLTPIGLAINVVLSTFLTSDDDAWYYRNVLGKYLKRRGQYASANVPGVMFLEVDGLAEPVLRTGSRADICPRSHCGLREGVT